MTQLQDILAQRILVLDGAMGTMIQSYGLEEEDFRNEALAHLPGQLKGNNDLLNLTRPDVVEDIARRYLTAGADILTTNTFSSQRISMADYHCEEFVRQLNVEGAKIARRVADEFMRQDNTRPRFVAGGVGPTNRTASIRTWPRSMASKLML